MNFEKSSHVLHAQRRQHNVAAARIEGKYAGVHMKNSMNIKDDDESNRADTKKKNSRSTSINDEMFACLSVRVDCLALSYSVQETLFHLFRR